MKKSLIYALCLSLVLAPFVQVAQAQKPEGPPKFFAKNASAEFKKKMSEANAKLKRMEDRLNNIEKSRKFSRREMEDMNTDIEEYGNKMWNLHNEAVGRVKEAGDTEGKKGGNEEFLYFEDTAKVHEKKLKALKEKQNRIENEIKNGKIKPGKDIIDTMTPEEKHEFKKSLTPEGRKEIEKTYPKMRSSFRSVPATKEFALFDDSDQEPTIVSPEALSVNDLCCSGLSEAIGNLFVSPAEAAVAAGCYPICAATIGIGCVACVLSAGGAAYSAYTSWRRCMRSCSCRWYRPWCCAKKVACTVVFIATLA